MKTIPHALLVLGLCVSTWGCGKGGTVSTGSTSSSSGTSAANGSGSGSTSASTGATNGTNGTGASNGTNGTGASNGTNGTGASTGSAGSNGSTGGGCGLVTCASAGANCGPIGDGCGGTVDCGTCGPHDFCGGGGASKCGPTACVPTTCTAQGATCGVISDGCGGTLSCGSCGAGEGCGLGGPNVCGAMAPSDGGSAPTCVPRTCASAGANCGPIADGCGGLTASCGTCTGEDICGGGDVPSVCGSSNRADAGVTCTGLCLQQQACSGGASTTITGTVFAPNGADPLYNALVYVPNGPVAPFVPGVSCLTCADQVSGQPLVSTNTGPDGKFTLTNMPAGANIPLVIQLGRWRRQITIPNVTACTSTAVAQSLTRLPKNHTEGDIPLTAMVTGSVDALECVLKGIGIDSSEFTNPSGGGRIQFYKAPSESNGQAPGATIDSSTPDGDQLFDTQTELDKYDMVLLSCEGSASYTKSTTHLQHLRDYANAGGRVFATHYSYLWLDTPTTWQSAANWNPNHDSGDLDTGTIDTTFQKGQDFSSWLDNVGASTSNGSNQIDIEQWRWDVDSVIPPTQRWIYLSRNNNKKPVEHLTFNTPYGATQQCGRVLFSDFHVADASTGPSTHFPNECGSSTTLTAQEHVLEFMLFDLASCITPDQEPPPVCHPTNCAAAGANCGPIADGCGGTLQCGTCTTAGQTCGGAGVPSMCGAATCTPRTCAEQNIYCGMAGDGCGGTIDCGGCTGGELCGGSGTANMCGMPSCTPTTCSAQGAHCGPIADGCGGTLDCGTCPASQTCGLGGANQCGGFQ